MHRPLLSSTIPAMIQHVIAGREQAPAMHWFAQAGWQSLSYQQLGSRIKNLGLGFIETGLQRGDHLAIIAPNCPEWILCDLAFASIGVVTVPIHPTLNVAAMKEILADSQARGMVLAESLLPKCGQRLQQHFKKKTAGVMFLLERQNGEAEQRGKDEPWLTLAKIEARGAAMADKRRFYARMEEVSADDLFTLVYTSGATGKPRGVMISHRNVLANIDGALELMGRFLNMPQECFLSFLPLAHAFERQVHYIMLAIGAKIAYARSLETVGEDLRTTEPTLFIAVPRFLEKSYARIREKVEGQKLLGRFLFPWLRRTALKRAAGKKVWTLPLAQLLFFNKIRARMGRRLRFAISGGGALDPDLARFFTGMQIPILEGYGLTEASTIIGVNPLDAIHFGTVGPPFYNYETRINDNNELLVRGPSVAKGYFRKPKESAEVFSKDGWLHTGDMVSRDEDGYLMITGRLKEILITAGGKSIAPQKLEHLLQELAWVDQACVVGDGKPFLVAVVVVSAQAKRILESSNATDTSVITDDDSLASLVLDERLWDVATAAIDKINEKLSSYETIKRFALLAEPFSQENDLLTPTLKLRRHAISATYAKVIELLYGDSSLVVENRIPLLPRDFKQSSQTTGT